MAASFVVYIDESGDEGFVFNADGTGSSRWFVLSAVVLRKNTELETVKIIDTVRAALKYDPKRKPLHFVDCGTSIVCFGSTILPGRRSVSLRSRLISLP